MHIRSASSSPNTGTCYSCHPSAWFIVRFSTARSHTSPIHPHYPYPLAALWHCSPSLSATSSHTSTISRKAQPTLSILSCPVVSCGVLSCPVLAPSEYTEDWDSLCRLRSSNLPAGTQNTGFIFLRSGYRQLGPTSAHLCHYLLYNRSLITASPLRHANRID